MSQQQSRSGKQLKASKKPRALTQGPDKRKKNKRRGAAKRKYAAAAPSSQARTERFYLSLCSKYYLRAICDPFSLDAGLACVPDLIDVPSSKIAAKARGTLVTGTTGFGFIACSPTIGSNNVPAVVFSTAAYTGTTVQGNGATNVSSANVSQLAYPNAQVSAIKQRTVGVGIRVRYLGTELNRSGRILGMRTQFGNSLVGLDTQSALGDAAVQSQPTSRKWTQVFWLPTTAADYDYLSSDQSIQDSADTTKACRLGFLIDGTVPGSSFEYEIRYHKEYANGDRSVVVVNNLSNSHSDTAGFSAIRNYFEGSIDYLGGSELYGKAINFLTNWSPSDISHVVSGVSGLARAYQGLA